MLNPKEFFAALRKAIPPNTPQNRALGGLLINMYEEIARLQKSALTIAKTVATSRVEAATSVAPPEAAEGGGEDDVDDLPQGTPLPPDIARAMEAANVSPDGEPTEVKPAEVAQPAPAPAQQARPKKSGGKQS